MRGNCIKFNKSAWKVQIFLHISKFCCTFAAQNESFAVLSPRWGYMSFGWVIYRTYWKRRLKRFVLAFWNLANSQLIQKHCSTRCPVVCIKRGTHMRTHVHTAWASVLFVQIRRQCESLRMRNGNSAVPLFLYIFSTNAWRWKTASNTNLIIINYEKSQKISTARTNHAAGRSMYGVHVL